MGVRSHLPTVPLPNNALHELLRSPAGIQAGILNLQALIVLENSRLPESLSALVTASSRSLAG